jgi:hypothetical protein
MVVVVSDLESVLLLPQAAKKRLTTATAPMMTADFSVWFTGICSGCVENVDRSVPVEAN